MASGYEQSEDYAGKEPSYRQCVAALATASLVMAALIAAFARYLFA